MALVGRNLYFWIEKFFICWFFFSVYSFPLTRSQFLSFSFIFVHYVFLLFFFFLTVQFPLYFYYLHEHLFILFICTIHRRPFTGRRYCRRRHDRYALRGKQNRKKKNEQQQPQCQLMDKFTCLALQTNGLNNIFFCSVLFYFGRRNKMNTMAT